MKENTCCFSGHRSLSHSDTEKISKDLGHDGIGFLTLGITDFCTGGAKGFDTLAAEKVLKFKKTNKDVRLLLFLPCKEQADKWDEKSRDRYMTILALADEVTYACEHYTSYCMSKRNRMLVDKSSVCITYLKRKTGGTAYTADYAKKQGLEIFNIAEDRADKPIVLTKQLEIGNI